MPCLCADAAVRHSTAATRLPLTRHRQLTTARHAAAFRAKGHARCNCQGCATCGGRCRGGQAWRAMSVRDSWNGGPRLARLWSPRFATLAEARTGSRTAACRRFIGAGFACASSPPSACAAASLRCNPQDRRRPPRLRTRRRAPRTEIPAWCTGLGIARNERVPPVEVAFPRPEGDRRNWAVAIRFA